VAVVTGVAFVAVGAVAGAWTRYLVGEFLDSHLAESGDDATIAPVSTFAVNVLGSALAGVVLGVTPPASVSFLVAVGFCGALTTFSSFAVETVALAQRDRPGLAALNACGNLAGTLLAVFVGIALGGVL
jgi:CrcB protein